MRKIIRYFINKLTIIALLVILQVALMIYLLFYFNETYTIVAGATIIIEIAVIINLVNRQSYPYLLS